MLVILRNLIIYQLEINYDLKNFDTSFFTKQHRSNKKFALCNITFESTLVPYREYLYFLKGLKSFAHCTTDPDWSKSIFLFVYVEFVFFPNIVELFNFSNSLIVYFSIDIVYSSLI